LVIIEKCVHWQDKSTARGVDMGKVTLAVLVLAIALGVYWFWWSDQGANSPITLEGTITVSGVPTIPGVSAPGGQQKADLTLQVLPNKVRVLQHAQGQTANVIIRLDKREIYYIDTKNKKYALEEFDLVDKSETELQEKGEETWSSDFTRTPEWGYVGTGEDKRFCNRQTATGLPKVFVNIATTWAGKGSAAAIIETMFKNMKLELWFTPEMRFGRRHFSTLNKLLRIRKVGSGVKQEGKRPQFEYVNLAFFPIPLRAVVSQGQMKIEVEVKRVSRGKISKDVFEVPSGFTKVSKQEISSALKSST
jgi:hypothetical protein